MEIADSAFMTDMLVWHLEEYHGNHCDNVELDRNLPEHANIIEHLSDYCFVFGCCFLSRLAQQAR